MTRQAYYLKPAFARQIQYGKTESRRAIGNVLEGVLGSYNYTSLAELNVILKQYNVMADRCRESSRVYRNSGLLYRILDDKGRPVGVPIKASSFYNKPGLHYLEERFKVNEMNRQPLKKRVKNEIDFYFIKQSKPSLEGMVKVLEKAGICTVLRQNDEGLLYGVTYVDHKNKVVFNGSDLGKPYSAKAILERCKETVPVAEKYSLSKQVSSIPKELETKEDKTLLPTSGADLMDTLMQPENAYEPVPYQLKKTRKKKRKKRLSDNK